MSRIDNVQICVHYSDFLEISLPINKKHFDNAIIVTTEDDKDTINLCKKEDVHCLVTDIFYGNGAKFNKGAGISLAYRYLREFLPNCGWVCNTDADTILPENFTERLDINNLDKEFFYGFRRRNFETKKDWDDFIGGRRKEEEFILYRGSGYNYCALFNMNSTTFNKLWSETQGWPYPSYIPNASESDWIYRNSWGERVFNPPLGKFPECHLDEEQDYDIGLYKELPINVYHLGMPGLNHNKRITDKFV